MPWSTLSLVKQGFIFTRLYCPELKMTSGGQKRQKERRINTSLRYPNFLM
jgi:hypothetical protein